MTPIDRSIDIVSRSAQDRLGERVNSQFCPQCGTARLGAFRFCRNCRFDFDTESEIAAASITRRSEVADPTTPVDQSPTAAWALPSSEHVPAELTQPAVAAVLSTEGVPVSSPSSRFTRRKVIVGVVVALVLIGGIGSALGAPGRSSGASPGPSSAGVATLPSAPISPTQQQIAQTPEPTVEPAAELTPEPTPAPTPKPTAQVTAEQENAIGTAEDYLDASAFSRSGLIGQLKYEGYSTAVATFAVDHVTVNWNEQAYLSAKAYLDLSHFSRSGLIGQLKYEGFTTKQATYGVTKAGL